MSTPRKSESAESLKADPSIGIYRAYAPVIDRIGGTPVPTRGKAVARREWSTATHAEICREIPRARHRTCGIGLRLGNGVVALDIDTDDDDIKRAVWGVLQEHGIDRALYGKRGARGATIFGYDPTGVIACRFWNDENDKRLVDLLAGPGKQTILPPSIHATTGRPYYWIGGSLYDLRSLDELPVFTPELIADIDKAIAPWVAKRPEKQPYRPSPQLSGDVTPVMLKRYRGWARKLLHTHADRIAGMSHNRSGSTNCAAYFVAPVWAVGAITQAEIETILAPAWETCGALAKYGPQKLRSIINCALNAGNALPLPDLEG